MAKITFSSIAIENFGPFRERQFIDLSVTAARSVILVKALNGSGKTTLLTALQIGLYGAKGTGSSRRTEYEQLVQSLQRSDVTTNSAISIELVVDMGGGRMAVTVRREWRPQPSTFTELFSVMVDGTQDIDLTQGWEEFIGGILPPELVSLFLFDGEKIEGLANPERLPELLRRATEVFLGIGGIDVLGNDLKAVERRSMLRNKDTSAEYETARSALLDLESQEETLRGRHADLLQEQASAQNTLDQTRLALDRYMAEARRGGLAAYEQAAAIRHKVETANARVSAARSSLAEAMSDAALPLLWLGDLWVQYEHEWEADKQTRHSKLLVDEFKKRDRRLLTALSKEVPSASVEAVRNLLKRDLDLTRAAADRKSLFLLESSPQDFALRIDHARARTGEAVTSLDSARRELTRSEQALGEVPAEEQLAEILTKMQDRSQATASAEQHVARLAESIAEVQSSLNHVQTRLNAARSRLSIDFRDRSLETKGLEAALRARRALSVFKDRLLASKAHWLSDMITTEFQNLLRKRKLVSRVVVDPISYEVKIEDGKGQELPMDRLSAGERQMLAVSVLSALIKERKGRFPVVVDTPLARLDGQHRTSLIKRFFATVSHQVLVLSTDEEVEGAAHDALRPYTNKEYVLEFNDELGHTTVRNGMDRTNSLEAA
ncbi:DNA sulfur modification protein DndD [Paraburkholderia tuberum]|uniref:DNA sulfur modification protein DndD n=1 Tax=Paraburkholderia tuberum TaxID=157910 RepID=A0A1H1DVF2_9BURK|nr:DNA sulfur modification protein DndD [Paraburkholderia tuberum]SDQ80239.1 DNA sulfur modification protein DndD [Paraburkholderia tuberum]